MLITPVKRPNAYCGRFAPSPSGQLHFGSLIAALASYLQAKSQQGTWLVRIEDIDPPREQAGVDKDILTTLDIHGLHWDESPLYQSQQSEFYQTILNELLAKKQAYYCRCTRKAIQNAGGFYQGHCRPLSHPATDAAIRLINDDPVYRFTDRIQGDVEIDTALAREDYIIHRRDGLFAYQLAVVADDIYQGITEIVRGCDLLVPTARQIHLFNHLGYQHPQYAHVPLAVTKPGFKLSKQNKAPALDNKQPVANLVNALTFLGHQPPHELLTGSVDELLTWAIANWQLTQVPATAEISL